jgi:hypothetical protein
MGAPLRPRRFDFSGLILPHFDILQIIAGDANAYTDTTPPLVFAKKSRFAGIAAQLAIFRP